MPHDMESTADDDVQGAGTLITGLLIGSMWFGTRHTSNHVLTVFNDCSHGSEMQCSAILTLLHEGGASAWR